MIIILDERVNILRHCVVSIEDKGELVHPAHGSDQGSDGGLSRAHGYVGVCSYIRECHQRNCRMPSFSGEDRLT